MIDSYDRKVLGRVMRVGEYYYAERLVPFLWFFERWKRLQHEAMSVSGMVTCDSRFYTAEEADAALRECFEAPKHKKKTTTAEVSRLLDNGKELETEESRSGGGY